MSYAFPPDIDAMVQRFLATGDFSTADDVLRAALEQLDTDDDDLRAIQESLDRLESGEEGIPLDEAFEQLRQKHNVPTDA